MRATLGVPPRSTRRITRPTAKKPNTITTTLTAPNPTIGSSHAGKPTSRITCASVSRSNASAPNPANSSVATSKRTRVCPRTKRMPFVAVVLSSTSARSRTSPAFRRNPVSGINTMQASPIATSSEPQPITAARSEYRPTAPKTSRPVSEPANPNRAPHRKMLATFYTPTSSVSQASDATLVHVYERPQNAQDTIATQGADEIPTPTTAAPIPITPTMNDNRRLYVSATTPVGTSDTKIVASIAVPIRISCSGVNSSTRTR